MLRGGWLSYLAQKNAGGGAEKSVWQVDTCTKERVLVVIGYYEELLLQLAGCDMPAGTGCHHPDVPRCRAKAENEKSSNNYQMITNTHQIITNN